MILLYRGISWVSRVIQWQTRTPYSHAAWMMRDGTVIEAWHVGGVRHNANPFLCHTSGTTVDVYDFKQPLSTAEHDRIESFLLSHCGRSYDFLGVFRFLTRDNCEPSNGKLKWFCSELVAEACADAGRRLLRAPSHQLSPGHLAWSTELIEVMPEMDLHEWEYIYPKWFQFAKKQPDELDQFSGPDICEGKEIQ